MKPKAKPPVVKRKKKYSVVAPYYAVADMYKVYSTYPTELWEKLSDEEKKYLVTFTQNYDAGYFSNKRPNVLPDKERRSSWQRQRERRRDAMMVGNSKGQVTMPFQSDGALPSHTNKSKEGIHEPGVANVTEDAMIESIDLRMAVRKARTAK